mgnify:CR=1 FL=1
MPTTVWFVQWFLFGVALPPVISRLENVTDTVTVESSGEHGVTVLQYVWRNLELLVVRERVIGG